MSKSIGMMCRRLRALGYEVIPPTIKAQDAVSLGQRLKMLREAFAYSLQNVADKIGVSKTYVWQMEKGDVDNPSIHIIAKLAKLYGVTIDKLYEETGNG